jgi:hypothetical protein
MTIGSLACSFSGAWVLVMPLSSFSSGIRCSNRRRIRSGFPAPTLALFACFLLVPLALVLLLLVAALQPGLAAVLVLELVAPAWVKSLYEHVEAVGGFD